MNLSLTQKPCYKSGAMDWGISMLQVKDKTITQVAVLLSRYGFELKKITIPELLEGWLASYSVYWIRLAIVEALYQGRYKAISVEYILSLWKRLGQPTYNFTQDFERLITGNLFLDDLTTDSMESDDVPINQQEIETVTEEIPANSLTLTPVQELLKNLATAHKIPSESSLSMSQENSFLLSEASQDDLDNNQDKIALNIPENDSNIVIEKTLSDNFNGYVKGPIHQFVPDGDSSEFYGKLRAVVHQELAENH
ncbi:hypothetical protein [Crocosphaera sp. XPORK-15E]|uniref:hypothetical protein n=1 Tax=Crocosphaera sp. XPORK-15E TaxID=3110247 RepID=UPI002B20819D|nr:hypothetical protein [Crocosphaera sp. XPORK-15E]MEA5535860.1 hypothetical protein [Crocosphaera sp. XPORK-15E]